MENNQPIATYTRTLELTDYAKELFKDKSFEEISEIVKNTIDTSVLFKDNK